MSRIMKKKMKNENNACRTKFQKKIVQNQAAQTSQRLTGIQNKPFRCKNFDYVYIVILSKHIFFFFAIGTSYGFSEKGFDNETYNSTGVYNKGHAQTSLCAQDCVFSA